MTQTELARATGTSQATISAYEHGAKAPSVTTLERLLAATGHRLVADAGHERLTLPSEREQARIARELTDVLALAAALPTTHRRRLGVTPGRPVKLPEKLVALHRTLDASRLAHAFGGAIALAYWTRDPRGTSDIDVNVFVPASEAARVLAALPAGVEQPCGAAERIARDGQMRLWWGQAPVDLFLDYEPIHAQAADNVRVAPFESTEIPVLGPTELAAFKAVVDRTRDWADVEAMAAAGALDATAVGGALGALLGVDDDRFDRLDEAVRRGREQQQR